MSMGGGLARNQSGRFTFARQQSKLNSTFVRTESLRMSVYQTSEMSQKQRQAKREEFSRRYRAIEQAERERMSTQPLLLSYLQKKARQREFPMEGSTIVFNEERTASRKNEVKNEKEDFLLDVMLTNSQIHIASLDTGSSLLLYLYKGSMIMQKKLIREQNYYFLNSSLDKVDLFIGDRHTQSSFWLSSNEIDDLNHIGIPRTSPSPSHFKRIVEDFSLKLVTRSQNSLIPKAKKKYVGNKQDLINRVSVTVGAFSVRMTGDQFSRFLDVIRFTLLVNPMEQTTTNHNLPVQTEVELPVTNSSNLSSSSLLSDGNRSAGSASTNPQLGMESVIANQNGVQTKSKEVQVAHLQDFTKEQLEVMKKEVSDAAKINSSMIPILCIKYSLKKVDWTLVAGDGRAIAIATLQGLEGDHTFYLDGCNETKVLLNHLHVDNPDPSPKDQWERPELIFHPQTLDRKQDDRSNFLEVIAVSRQYCMKDGTRVQIYDHVGINVYPGCHYSILVQLSMKVAKDVIKYFFPEEGEEGEEGEMIVYGEETSQIADSISTTTTTTAVNAINSINSQTIKGTELGRVLPPSTISRNPFKDSEITMEISDEENESDLEEEEGIGKNGQKIDKTKGQRDTQKSKSNVGIM